MASQSWKAIVLAFYAFCVLCHSLYTDTTENFSSRISLSESNGTLSNQHCHNFYSNSSNCSLNLSIPSDSSLWINFTSCSGDVSVIDGAGKVSTNSCRVWHYSPDVTSIAILAHGPHVVIKLQNPLQDSFELSWIRTPSVSTLTQSKNAGCYLQGNDVGVKPRDGFVYSVNATCTWIIVAPSFRSLTINISDFDVEYGGSQCVYDSLQVFDGPDTSFPQLGTFCGHKSPFSVESSRGVVVIQFRSDRSLTGKGWTGNIVVKETSTVWINRQPLTLTSGERRTITAVPNKVILGREVDICEQYATVSTSKLETIQLTLNVSVGNASSKTCQSISPGSLRVTVCGTNYVLHDTALSSGYTNVSIKSIAYNCATLRLQFNCQSRMQFDIEARTPRQFELVSAQQPYLVISKNVTQPRNQRNNRIFSRIFSFRPPEVNSTEVPLFNYVTFDHFNFQYTSDDCAYGGVFVVIDKMTFGPYCGSKLQASSSAIVPNSFTAEKPFSVLRVIVYSIPIPNQHQRFYVRFRTELQRCRGTFIHNLERRDVVSLMPEIPNVQRNTVNQCVRVQAVPFGTAKVPISNRMQQVLLVVPKVNSSVGCLSSNLCFVEMENETAQVTYQPVIEENQPLVIRTRSAATKQCDFTYSLVRAPKQTLCTPHQVLLGQRCSRELFPIMILRLMNTCPTSDYFFSLQLFLVADISSNPPQSSNTLPLSEIDGGGSIGFGLSGISNECTTCVWKESELSLVTNVPLHNASKESLLEYRTDIQRTSESLCGSALVSHSERSYQNTSKTISYNLTRSIATDIKTCPKRFTQNFDFRIYYENLFKMNTFFDEILHFSSNIYYKKRMHFPEKQRRNSDCNKVSIQSIAGVEYEGNFCLTPRICSKEQTPYCVQAVYSTSVSNSLPVAWLDAEAICKRLNLSLPMMTSTKRRDWLLNTLVDDWGHLFDGRNYPLIHLGLRRVKDQLMVFFWNDGTPLITTWDWYRPTNHVYTTTTSKWAVKYPYPQLIHFMHCAGMIPDLYELRSNLVQVDCAERWTDLVVCGSKASPPTTVPDTQKPKRTTTSSANPVGGAKASPKHRRRTTIATPIAQPVERTSLSVNKTDRGLVDFKNHSYCPDGWAYFDGSCLKMLSSPHKLDKQYTFDEAEKSCEWINGTVLSYPGIPLHRIVTYLRTQLQKTEYGGIWIKDEDECLFLTGGMGTQTDDSWEIVAASCDSFGVLNVICQTPPLHLGQNCTMHQFPCSDGSCILFTNQCNGIADCPNREDESNCEGIMSTRFRCEQASAFFVDYSYLCDNLPDCELNGRDEEHCAPLKCSPDTEFSCEEVNTKTTISCLPLNKRCDGVPDCYEKVDEYGCRQHGCQAGVPCGAICLLLDMLSADLDKYCAVPESFLIPPERISQQCIMNQNTDNCSVLTDMSLFNATEVQTIIGDEGNATELSNMNLPGTAFLPFCPENPVNSVRCGDVSSDCMDRSLMCVYSTHYHGIRGCFNKAHLQYCDDFQCPHLFKCPRSYCIQNHLRCNGKPDCPGGEDEKDCEDQDCSGKFRCFLSLSSETKIKTKTSICIDHHQVCDGIPQCGAVNYISEDEMFCDVITCPRGCVCKGYNMHCKQSNLVEIPSNITAQLRYLDASDNKIHTLTYLGDLKLLVYLNIARNGLHVIKKDAFSQSHNLLTLLLPGNHLTRINTEFHGLTALKTLDLSDNKIEVIATNAFAGNTLLTSLKLSGNKQLHITKNVFSAQPYLQYVSVDSYRFCFGIENCEYPVDAFSDEKMLLKNKGLRASVWIVGCLAFFGNCFVIQWRLLLEKSRNSVLITNLAISDILMGGYVITIGFANELYAGEYLSVVDRWLQSGLCKSAGFAAYLSSEMSLFILALMTVERCYSIANAMRGKKSSSRAIYIAVILGWVVWITLSSLPLIASSHFEGFYNSNGVCLPFHLGSPTNSGRFWLSFMTVCINVAFLLILVTGYAYIFIYVTMSRSQTKVASKPVNVEVKLATRLLIIVITDFLCWAPVIITAFIRTFAGHVYMPDSWTAYMAILLLPLNSAVNPILYTISVMGPRLQRARQAVRSTMRQTPSMPSNHAS